MKWVFMVLGCALNVVMVKLAAPDEKIVALLAGLVNIFCWAMYGRHLATDLVHDLISKEQEKVG